jgi:hypothetical protein
MEVRFTSSPMIPAATITANASRRARWPLPLIGLQVLLGACTLTQPAGPGGKGAVPLESIGSVSEAGMTCAQATGVARRALLKLGYTIDKVEPAKSGVVGKVVGLRNTGWTPRIVEEGDVYRTEIAVHCSDSGSTFEGSTSEGFSRRMSLRRDYPEALAAVIQQPVRAPRVKQEPDQGLIITVEAQRSREASAIFGSDLPSSGITPVQVKIDNRTERTYGFSRDRVKLVTQDGRNAPPLTAQDLSTKLGASLPTQLEGKLIAEGDLGPGANRTGFMYFPAAAYRRATIILLDLETDEPEGFNVEF